MPPKRSKGKSDKAHKAAVSAIAAAAAATDSKRKPSGRGGKVAAGEGDLSANGHAVEGEAEEAEPVGALTMISPRPTETAAEAPARPPTPAPVPAPMTTSMAEMAPEKAAETAPETVPETAPESSGVLRRLLRSPGNERCFDCDELLQEPWFSLSYGVLLCECCASEHPGASALPPGGTVRPLPEEARVTADELRSLELGGNARFRAFLEGETIGVSAAVWSALPIELRWCTPAADLHRRRLRAQVAGEAEENLPTEMLWPTDVPPSPRQALEKYYRDRGEAVPKAQRRPKEDDYESPTESEGNASAGRSTSPPRNESPEQVCRIS